MVQVLLRSPVLAAWGAGVDSTAMLIELVDRGSNPRWRRASIGPCR